MKTNSNLFSAKKQAVNTWKESTFSLSGITNYIVKNYKEDQSLKDALSCVPGITPASNQTELREVFTFDFIKSCLGERGLYKLAKNEQTGKLEPTDQPRTRFSLWVVLTAIQRQYK